MMNVSLAKSPELVSFKQSLKSFIYRRKRSGSIVDPWGTPEVISSKDDSETQRVILFANTQVGF